MLLLIVFLMVYPLYFTIIASVSNPTDVATGKVYFFPSGINWMGYREIFKEKSIWRGYLVSLYYTGVGTLFNLFLTFPTAYALSKKKMHFRKGIQAYFIFTMFFGGGLLPFYMLVRDLNLLNKPYTMIVLGDCPCIMWWWQGLISPHPYQRVCTKRRRWTAVRNSGNFFR